MKKELCATKPEATKAVQGISGKPKWAKASKRLEFPDLRSELWWIGGLLIKYVSGNCHDSLPSDANETIPKFRYKP
jgi:hypothetical protein